MDTHRETHDGGEPARIRNALCGWAISGLPGGRVQLQGRRNQRTLEAWSARSRKTLLPGSHDIVKLVCKAANINPTSLYGVPLFSLRQNPFVPATFFCFFSVTSLSLLPLLWSVDVVRPLFGRYHSQRRDQGGKHLVHS